MRPGAAPHGVGEAGVAVAEVRGGADVVVSVTASASRHLPRSALLATIILSAKHQE